MSEKKFLLIIDPQKGFKNKKTEKAFKKIDEISDYFDIVFASLFFNPDNSLYKNLLYWHSFAKQKDARYFDLAIKKSKKIKTIETHKYGKLNWKIKLYLKLYRIKTVFICGMETDACVYKTALDVFDMGLTPVIIEDACGSCRGKEFHDMGIALAKRQIGEDQVIPFAEVKNKLDHKIVEVM
jgi:nicotinamidase-related amidase